MKRAARGGRKERATRQPQNRRRCEIWLILGPSGVGKSCFAQYLQRKLHRLYLEIDQFPRGDGIDIHDLREPWDMFLGRMDATALAEELCKRAKEANVAGCILSFPSGLVLSPKHIDAARTSSVKVIYLYGTAADCISAFLERERQSGRNLDIHHWLDNNTQPYMAMSRPEFARHRFHMFDEDGKRREHSDILNAINSRFGKD
jgi:gluconate kinase